MFEILLTWLIIFKHLLTKQHIFIVESLEHAEKNLKKENQSLQQSTFSEMFRCVL